jgi:hypothetical protein
MAQAVSRAPRAVGRAAARWGLGQAHDPGPGEQLRADGGLYSQAVTTENYLRGVQAADSNGVVTVTRFGGPPHASRSQSARVSESASYW